MLMWPAKDPDEVLDYVVNWEDRLVTDETISTSLFFIDSYSGVSVQITTNNRKTATVWLTGGSPGKTAEILNRITTSSGRTMDETVLLPIRIR